MITATLQATALSSISNILAQIFDAYNNQASTNTDVEPTLSADTDLDTLSILVLTTSSLSALDSGLSASELPMASLARAYISRTCTRCHLEPDREHCNARRGQRT